MTICRQRLVVCAGIVMGMLIGGGQPGGVGASESSANLLHREPMLAPEPVQEQVSGDPRVPGTVAAIDPESSAPGNGDPIAASALPPAAELPAIAVSPALPTMVITDLELSDVVDVVTLLRLMARLADVNMLISPKVEGAIGFSFRGVAWDQAFLSILSSSGLTYSWQGDVLRVMTIEDVRRELEMAGALRDRENARQDLRQAEPMVMRVIPVRYMSAENIGKSVASMITGAAQAGGVATQGKAAVSVDGESNTIIVHASRADVDKAVDLVERLDRIRPLVQIEAKIVEATRDTARQLGMQWGGQTGRLQGGRLVTASGGAATAGGYASDFPAQFASGLEAPAGFSLGLVSERIGMNELLNLQLTALQQQGRINIQASPSVTTLDNEMAVIESGEERAYRTSTGTGNENDAQVEWKKAVLKLEVTPHVVDGNKLRVVIVANKDSFDETKPTTNNEFPVNTKRARTTVMLADGETTMIGGLSLESSSETTAGVPFLMRIPLLGFFFRNKSSSGRFNETIIFITPTIL